MSSVKRFLALVLVLLGFVQVHGADLTVHRYFYDNNGDGQYGGGDTLPSGFMGQNLPDDWIRLKFVPLFLGESTRIPPSGSHIFRILGHASSTEQTLWTRPFAGAATVRDPVLVNWLTGDGSNGGVYQPGMGVYRDVRGYATVASVPAGYTAAGFGSNASPRRWHRLKWEYKALSPGTPPPFKKYELLCEVPYDLGLQRLTWSVEIYSSQRIDCAVEYWICVDGFAAEYRINPAGNPPALQFLNANFDDSTIEPTPRNVWVFKRLQGVGATQEWYRGTVSPGVPLVLRDANVQSIAQPDGSTSDGTVTDATNTDPGTAPAPITPPVYGKDKNGNIVSTNGNGLSSGGSTGGGGGDDGDDGIPGASPNMGDVPTPDAGDVSKMAAIKNFADNVGPSISSLNSASNAVATSVTTKAAQMDGFKTGLSSVASSIPGAGTWDWKVPLEVGGTLVSVDLGPYRTAFQWLRAVLVVIVLVAFWKATGTTLRKTFNSQ